MEKLKSFGTELGYFDAVFIRGFKNRVDSMPTISYLVENHREPVFLLNYPSTSRPTFKPYMTMVISYGRYRWLSSNTTIDGYLHAFSISTHIAWHNFSWNSIRIKLELPELVLSTTIICRKCDQRRSNTYALNQCGTFWSVLYVQHCTRSYFFGFSFSAKRKSKNKLVSKIKWCKFVIRSEYTCNRTIFSV